MDSRSEASQDARLDQSHLDVSLVTPALCEPGSALMSSALQHCPGSSSETMQPDQFQFRGIENEKVEEESGATPVKRKSRQRDAKTCLVCGDKALGYNFNALTCESCKAFFRRNAHKKNNPDCIFQGNCMIDVRTRRFCPHCRLVKCFSIGMKKEMILDVSERRARMEKVMKNRERKQKTVSQSSDMSDVSVKEEPHSDSEMLPDQSEYSLPPEQAPASQYNSVLESMIKPCPDQTINILKTPQVLGEDPKDPSVYRILLPEEFILFRDIKSAYSRTLGEMMDRSSSSYKNCTDLVNNSEIAVRKLIKFIKCLDDFNKLTMADQMGILKSCVLGCILLRSAFFYNIERDCWVTSSGEIPTSILKNATGYKHLHEVHTSFCSKTKQLLGDDYVLFALVQIICIFQVDSKEIQSKSFISNIQDKYLVLLKHYLESSQGYVNAQSLFSKILVVIMEMKKTLEAHNTILLNANLDSIEPLMLEVLDLK